MSDYYKYPLNKEYDFVGKFADGEERENDYGGLIKFRPGYLTSIQLATGSLRGKEHPNIMHGQVFQDGSTPQLCTLIHCNGFNKMAGFSSAGFKAVGFYQFLVMGNCLDDEDVVTGINYSSNLVQCFFAPKGHKFEQYSKDKITFTFKGFNLEVWQYASGSILGFMPETELISSSQGFKDELYQLIEKYKEDDGVGPGIKKDHLWVISINKPLSVDRVGDYDAISKSLETLFFLLTGYLSAPTGIKIDIRHADENAASYDVLRPVTTGNYFDKNFDNYSDRFDLQHPITIKSLGVAKLQVLAKAWEKNEDKFHYIIQALKSNHNDRRDVHSGYIFSRTIDALEAICEIDGKSCKTQAAKIEYAINNYASTQTKTYFNNTAGHIRSVKNELAAERGKIVHPKSSHKEIWDNQKKYYNWAIAIDSILYSYVQRKLGIEENLSYEFQDSMVKYNLRA